MFCPRGLLTIVCSVRSARTRCLPHHQRSPSLQFISTSARFLQTAKALTTGSGLITPESRLRDLRNRGFHEYPRSDGSFISEIEAFRKRWSGKIAAGETDVSDGLITGMVAAKPSETCLTMKKLSAGYRHCVPLAQNSPSLIS